MIQRAFSIIIIVCFYHVALADSIVPEERLATNQWSQYTGVQNGIPDRTIIYTTFTSSATSAQINSAIGTCPSNQIIMFLAGNYDNLSSALSLGGRNGIELRGSNYNSWPPTSTVFRFTGSGSDGVINSLNPYHEPPDTSLRTTTWSSGFSRGTTSITVSSAANMHVGDIICLDQTNDIPNAVTAYGNEGNCGSCDLQLDGKHVQQQHVEVTSISGTTIGITPPLIATNWASALNPRVIWTDDQSGGAMNGIRGITITMTNYSGTKPDMVVKARWVKDFYVKDCIIEQTKNFGVRFSDICRATVDGVWFKDNDTHGSQCYAVAIYQGSSGLVVNNIFSPYTSGVITGGGAEGWVVAYNFSTNCFFENVSASAIASSVGFHAGYANYFLVEGNWFQKGDADNIHGSAGYVAFLRNRFQGAQTGKTSETHPIQFNGSNWNMSVVANILGLSGYHTNYNRTNTGGPNGNYVAYHLNEWPGQSPGGCNCPDQEDVSTMNTMIRSNNYMAFQAYGVITNNIPSNETNAATPATSWFLPNANGVTNDFGILLNNFPPINPLNASVADPTNILSGYRFYFGTNPPALAASGGGGAGFNRRKVRTIRLGP